MTKDITRLAEDSQDAFEELKVITDSVYAKTFVGPWSPSVLKILTAYGINVERKKGIKAQVNISIPKSTENPSISVGIRYMKDATHFAEDLHVFEKGIGIKSHYKGAQERLLPEYKGTHHAPMEISEFLPDIQKEIDSIKQSITLQTILAGINTDNIMTPSEYKSELERQGTDARRKVDNLMMANPGAPKEQVSKAVHVETQQQYTTARTKWFASERLYEAKMAEIELLYPDLADAIPHVKALNKLFGK